MFKGLFSSKKLLGLIILLFIHEVALCQCLSLSFNKEGIIYHVSLKNNCRNTVYYVIRLQAISKDGIQNYQVMENIKNKKQLPWQYASPYEQLDSNSQISVHCKIDSTNPFYKHYSDCNFRFIASIISYNRKRPSKDIYSKEFNLTQ